MKLNQLLPVGKSFRGLREEKSPYQMRKEELLPIFDSHPRFAAPIPAPGLPEAKKGGGESVSGKAPREGRSWLSIFTFGLLGKKRGARPLVQSELNLEKVQVVRNDLADADLELVFKKKKKRPAPAVAAVEISSSKDAGWSRMAVRLFEVGQSRERV